MKTITITAAAVTATILLLLLHAALPSPAPQLTAISVNGCTAMVRADISDSEQLKAAKAACQ